MTTLTNKRKLETVAMESQKEHPRNSQSRNTAVSGLNEEYITQMSEDIRRQSD